MDVSRSFSKYLMHGTALTYCSTRGEKVCVCVRVHVYVYFSPFPPGNATRKALSGLTLALQHVALCRLIARGLHLAPFCS